ncbi:RING-14 protein-like protein [Byssothecium circinans]|uniref:RING-14 protein-like protein n=1 Tax=Byssothecium circinans TaxID=147558 RepID=A0A6A5TN19_9PLEO|nr:RING-14 protein-like protein [Byssothecium circinans]
MKFGQVFKEALRNDGFPSEWIDSAISYSQLKKCINSLTDELAQVGLDPATLEKLLKHVEDYNASAEKRHGDEFRPFEYILGNGDGEKKTFQPKLLFYVEEATGALHSAKLNKETWEKLQLLAVETGMSDLKVYEEEEEDESDEKEDSTSSNGQAKTDGKAKKHGLRTVEVPLTSDTEFFTKLTTELSGLEALQAKEEKRMHAEIEDLGRQIARLTDPDRKANRKILAVWRQIFQLYLEESIFFGATERDHAAHDAQEATARFQDFCKRVKETGLLGKLKKRESVEAMDMFMHINREILQGLKFGEINHTAMSKILKKFDKRTALGVKSTLPSTISYPQFSQHLAKAVCAEVNTQVLSHVPQIDDYTCPMCTEIKWRPVKLACGHTFCIRCLVVMQSKKQNNCPLCREKCVAAATEDNLDLKLADFLKKWFPDEVKAKQKYNELMAGVDAYGEGYSTHRCIVM